MKPLRVIVLSIFSIFIVSCSINDQSASLTPNDFTSAPTPVIEEPADHSHARTPGNSNVDTSQVPQDPGKPLFTKKGGPADEFSKFVLDLKKTGRGTSVATYKVNFSKDGQAWQADIPIADAKHVTFSLITKKDVVWDIELVDPSQQSKKLERSMTGGARTEVIRFPEVNYTKSKVLPEASHASDHFSFEPNAYGNWNVKITPNDLSLPAVENDGVLLVSFNSDYKLYHYLSTAELSVNKEVGIKAYLYKDNLMAALEAQNRMPTANSGINTDPEKPDATGLPYDNSKTFVDPENSAKNTEIKDQKPEFEELLDAPRGYAARPLINVISKAVIRLTDSANNKFEFPLNDDGLSNDDRSNDGIYGVFLPALAAGQYQYEIYIEGVTPQGQTIVRNSAGRLTILGIDLAINDIATSNTIVATGDPIVDETNQDRIEFVLDVSINEGELPESLRTYAEVWSVDKSGREKAVAWIGGLVAPVNLQDGGAAQIPLSFHLDWLNYANVEGPFVLKNVRLGDPETNYIIGASEHITLNYPKDVEDRVNVHKSTKKSGNEISEEMRSGFNPYRPISNNTHLTQKLVNPVNYPVVLVHGMGDSNPWPTADFDDYGSTGYRTFYGPNTTGRCVSNNTFAKDLDSYVRGLPSSVYGVGIVAHSQGGMAALQYYDDYLNTKLRYGVAPKLIQSVGTPYNGAIISGYSYIGAILGVSCAAPVELTPIGAIMWRLWISPSSESKVHYKRTAHNEWTWNSWDFCSILSYGIISGDDDGVVGEYEGILSGGNNEGLGRAYCHSGGLNHTAQYKDYGFNHRMLRWSFPSYDVGIIPESNYCGWDMDKVEIHMDDEDSNNANKAPGWIGATGAGRNTTWRFCRVTKGDYFRPLSSNYDLKRQYAVLKLGTHCPPGSLEFRRYFDNEDKDNANWSSGDTFPNNLGRNTEMHFCLFKENSYWNMSGFPDVGQPYGVFAAGDFALSLSSGYRHTDDEDSSNKNSYTWFGGTLSEINRIISGGSNTDVRMVKVK